MTDIDALIARVAERAANEYGTDHEFFLEIVGALTAERARVVELEGALETARDALYHAWCESRNPLTYADYHIADAALTAHTEAREEPHDKG